MKIRKQHIVLVIFLCSQETLSQDLETLNDQKWLEYSGGIGLNNTFYNAIGIPNRRDPYFWQFNANLNFTILGIVHMPFSLTLSQQNKNFSQPQPFNRFGMSPRYKDYTVHLGHRSMNFSSYTLAGNLFFGIGAEYEPESNPLRVSALYGRFTKPVRRSARDGFVFAEPAFRRIGYGTKVGFNTGDHEGHLILFTARDDPGSLKNWDSLLIRPEENLVLGLVTSNKILRVLTLKVDYGYSLYSSNLSSPEVFIDEFTFVNNLGGLFTPTSSSRYSTALTTDLVYSAERFQVNGKYRRVDPEYTTLGSSFLNNDMEDISAGLSFPLFQNRVTLSTNGGVQRNNLDNQLTTNLRRFIFSTSVSWNVSEKLQISGNYGNFNSSTEQIQIQENVLVDTLEFFQVSRNGSINSNYSIGSSESPFILSWSGNVQEATNSERNTSTFLSSIIGVQKKFGEWSVNVSGSSNQNRTETYENLTIGPTTSVNRSFLKGQYRFTVSASFLSVIVDEKTESNVTNYRVTGNIRPWKKHSVAVSAFYMTRNMFLESDIEEIKEFRASVNYAFRI